MGGERRRGGFSGDGIAGMNITMPQLAKRLTKVMARPVLDRTELAGAWDFKYPYAANAGERPDLVSSLIASLNAIGLKLESSKAPIERIVVDRLERPTLTNEAQNHRIPSGRKRGMGCGPRMRSYAACSSQSALG